MEDQFEAEEDRFITLKARYDEATKLQDENERAHKELSNRGQVDTVKLERLEREIMELQEQVESVEQDYQDVSGFYLGLNYILRHTCKTLNFGVV